MPFEKDSGYEISGFLVSHYRVVRISQFFCAESVCNQIQRAISRVAIPGRRRFQQDRRREEATRMFGPELDALVRTKDSRK